MDYTLEEVEKVRELRKRVEDHLIHDYQRDDSFLIRWLRARQLNLDKAEEMLKKSLEWRKENQIDGYCDKELPKEFAAQIPFAHCGNDPETGCPVFLYLMGRADIRSALEELGPEKLEYYSIVMTEQLLKMMRELSEKLGKPVTQFIEIIDLDGFSYRQFASKAVRDYMANSQRKMDANYPELMRHATLVNTPKIFTILFSFMRHVVPKETIAKIDIHGTDSEKWKKALAAKYPMDLLPKRWGGKLEGSDEYCSQSEIWMFGPLHPKFFKNGGADGFDTSKVKVGGKVLLDFEVLELEGSNSLSWKFKSENYDIAFGVLLNGKEIVPIERVESHKAVQEGRLECKSLGTYSLVFDNSYSYSREKIIHHKVDIISQEGDADGKVRFRNSIKGNSLKGYKQLN